MRTSVFCFAILCLFVKFAYGYGESSSSYGSTASNFKLSLRMYEIGETAQPNGVHDAIMPFVGLGMGSDVYSIEALLGYRRESTSPDDDIEYEYSESTWGIGVAGAYNYLTIENAKLDLGLSFIYAKNGHKEEDIEGKDESDNSSMNIYPSVLIGFDIPGAESISLFSEFGLRYSKVSCEQYDYSSSAWEIYGMETIVSGISITF